MRKVLILPIGIPASGKTTFYGKVKKFLNNLKYLSLDRERLVFLIEKFGLESIKHFSFQKISDEARRIYLSNRGVFFKRVDEKFSKMIKNNSVYYDAINVESGIRRKIIRIARKSNPDILVYGVIMDCNLETCLERNKKRNRVVPEDYILWSQSAYTEPSLEEGFDKIFHTPKEFLKFLSNEGGHNATGKDRAYR